MRIYQLILCVLLGVIGINGKPPSQILGGSEAIDGEFPYQAALKVWGFYICSGSIIDSLHILTAAHCVEDNKGNLLDIMTITTGTNYNIDNFGNVHRIKSITIHPSYAPSQQWKNDIAILTLTKEIKFDAKQKPIKLPKADTAGGAVAKASGWGDRSFPNGATPVKLQKLDMKVLAKGECSLPSGSVHDSQLCALNKRGSGLCSGDSGGPLVHDEVIIGIASWVYPCALGYPDVFTRVYNYINWIKNVTSK